MKSLLYLTNFIFIFADCKILVKSKFKWRIDQKCQMIAKKEEDILKQVIIEVLSKANAFSYTYTHFTAESEPGTTFEKLATFLSWILVLVLFPFSLYCCYVKVNEFNRVLIFRLGRVRYYI